jgi:hypothetical protein
MCAQSAVRKYKLYIKTFYRENTVDDHFDNLVLKSEAYLQLILQNMIKL